MTTPTQPLAHWGGMVLGIFAILALGGAIVGGIIGGIVAIMRQAGASAGERPRRAARR